MVGHIEMLVGSMMSNELRTRALKPERRERSGLLARRKAVRNPLLRQIAHAFRLVSPSAAREARAQGVALEKL
jgi:hypothetical protein